jgi:uncharacterized protein (TIGR02996 family)
MFYNNRMGPDEQALLAAVIADPEDDLPRLAYADWLDEHGDPHRAKYIRARLILDGPDPTGGDYATTFERFLEGHAAMWRRPDPALPAGFRLRHNYGSQDEWWSDGGDGMERGFPSFVRLDGVERDGPTEATLLIRQMAELVRDTPVRGIDFEEHFAAQMGRLLNSRPGRRLTRLDFANRPQRGQPGPVIAALAASPAARGLLRLNVGEGVLSDVDADALAGARFDRLRRFDSHIFECSRKAIIRLTEAAWFRRLHRALVAFNAQLGEAGMLRLAGMPNLHTLCLWFPDEPVIRALGRAGEFPALGRLLLHGTSLKGEAAAALGRARMPRLIERWVRNSPADVPALAASPLGDGLRVLTFDSTPISATGLKAVAARPFAARLRILRIHWGQLRSLEKTPLTQPGTFPALTTLKLINPYGMRVKQKDTAAFLRGLATPNLRHLALRGCDFDDDCAAAVATNPTFANLTRLIIERGTMGPKAAERLFRSKNLRDLIELKVSYNPIGKAAGVLADASVLPALAECWIDSCQVPEGVVKKLKERRPMVDAS